MASRRMRQPAAHSYANYGTTCLGLPHSAREGRNFTVHSLELYTSPGFSSPNNKRASVVLSNAFDIFFGRPPPCQFPGLVRLPAESRLSPNQPRPLPGPLLACARLRGAQNQPAPLPQAGSYLFPCHCSASRATGESPAHSPYGGVPCDVSSLTACIVPLCLVSCPPRRKRVGCVLTR
jgi:hypothetical protein